MRGHVTDVLYGDRARGAGGEGGADDECDEFMMLGGMGRAPWELCGRDDGGRATREARGGWGPAELWEPDGGRAELWAPRFEEHACGEHLDAGSSCPIDRVALEAG